MIQVKKLRIEWFGSMQELSYNFDRRGLNTIHGFNGAGKSTLLNALTWCVYKQLLKKNSTIEPWPHVINETYKGTKVSLTFKKDGVLYEIIRCLNYKGKVLNKAGRNRLVLLKEGKEYTGKGKINIQQEIINLWGYSFDLFKSAVVFGQRVRRFIEEDGPAKKKIFDEAFESTFISRAKELVANRLQQKEKDYEIITIKTQASRTSLQSARSNLKDIKEIIQTFNRTQLKKIAELRKKSEDLAKTLEKAQNTTRFKKLPTLMRTVEGKVAKLQKEFNEAQSIEFDMTLRLNEGERDVENRNAELNDLKTKRAEIPDKCSKCGEPIPKKKRLFYKKQINEELQAVNERLGEAIHWLRDLKIKYEKQKELVETLKTKLSEKKAKLTKLEKTNIQRISEEERVKSQWAIYYNYLEQIKSLKQEKAPVKNLQSAKKQVISCKRKYEDNKRKFIEVRKALKVDKWLISDPLSNSGLKAFIFDSMVGKVNAHLATYKTIIGFDVSIGVDMKSARKDIDLFITKNGDEVPIQDLSGGQGQMAAIATLFALSDTVYASKPINILIMDEAFESLDKDNISKVEDIIRKKANTRAIHLITHNDNFNPLNAYKTCLELQSGITNITNRFRDN